jgi:hypothetical protein
MRRLASCFVIGMLGCSGGGEAPDPDPCVGLTCEEPPMEGEGGNVIFEYLELDTQLQTAFGLPEGIESMTRVVGYFMSEHPDSTFPLPGECVNMEGVWPLYVDPAHTDIDVGTLTITGVNEADAPSRRCPT